jgi:Fur family ferric uptake transcriptional regulator
LEEIKKSNSHPTADDIYESVRKRLPKISLGTIYRNIEILYENGLIEKIGPASSQMRYDGITKNHYHIRCIRCGRVVDAPIETINRLNDDVRRQTDYMILGHRLEYVGICPDCRKKEDEMQ